MGIGDTHYNISLKERKKKRIYHKPHERKSRSKTETTRYFCTSFPVHRVTEGKAEGGGGMLQIYVPVPMTIQHRGHRPSHYFAVFAKMAVGSFSFFGFSEKFINTRASLFLLEKATHTHVHDPALARRDDDFATRDLFE